jgi:hypothetical protein
VRGECDCFHYLLLLLVLLLLVVALFLRLLSMMVDVQHGPGLLSMTVLVALLEAPHASGRGHHVAAGGGQRE